MTVDRYVITGKGKDAFDETLDWLESRMIERGGRGTRRNRKRGEVPNPGGE